MVLQNTEHRRRPPIVVEGAPPIDHITAKALSVLDAAKAWDAEPEKFGNALRAPRLGWAGLFEAAAATGVEPCPMPSAMVGGDGRLVFLA